MVEKEGYVDWRINRGMRATEYVSPVFEKGPQVNKGDILYHCTLTRDSEGELIGFITPSPPALALNIAINAAKEASRLRELIEFQKSPTPHGEGKSVMVENSSALFDYFESCMIAATFSIQALEVFCNTVIADYLKGTLPIKIQKKGKPKYLNANQIQEASYISLKIKIDDIIPRILKISSPKYAPESGWDEFLKLNHVRVKTIHMKSSDAYNGVGIDDETLFYEFFRTDPTTFPQYALDIMNYFSESIGDPKWINEASNLMKTGEE